MTAEQAKKLTMEATEEKYGSSIQLIKDRIELAARDCKYYLTVEDCLDKDHVDALSVYFRNMGYRVDCDYTNRKKPTMSIYWYK